MRVFTSLTVMSSNIVLQLKVNITWNNIVPLETCFSFGKIDGHSLNVTEKKKKKDATENSSMKPIVNVSQVYRCGVDCKR